MVESKRFKKAPGLEIGGPEGMALFLCYDPYTTRSFRSMRILVVDDNPLIRWSLDRSLAARGHTVTSAACGNEALSLLRSTRYDLILTDVKLPGPDGFMVADSARERFPDIPVIMFSAHGTDNIRHEAGRRRINHFLDKPISVDDVVELVERCVRMSPDAP